MDVTTWLRNNNALEHNVTMFSRTNVIRNNSPKLETMKTLNFHNHIPGNKKHS